MLNLLQAEGLFDEKADSLVEVGHGDDAYLPCGLLSSIRPSVTWNFNNRTITKREIHSTSLSLFFRSCEEFQEAINYSHAILFLLHISTLFQLSFCGKKSCLECLRIHRLFYLFCFFFDGECVFYDVAWNVAARSRKYQVDKKNNLVVRRVGAEDRGMYECKVNLEEEKLFGSRFIELRTLSMQSFHRILWLLLLLLLFINKNNI